MTFFGTHYIAHHLSISERRCKGRHKRRQRCCKFATMIQETFFFVIRKKVERFFPIISPPVFSLSGQSSSTRKSSNSATKSMSKSSNQHRILNLLWGFLDAKSLSLFLTKRRISSLRSNDTDNSSLMAQIF